MQNIDPKIFGLHPSTLLKQKNKNNYELIINRKSRFIMKDGRKVLEKIQQIQEIQPGAKVSLRISSPMCSKTKTFLESKGLTIILNKQK